MGGGKQTCPFGSADLSPSQIVHLGAETISYILLTDHFSECGRSGAIIAGRPERIQPRRCQRVDVPLALFGDIGGPRDFLHRPDKLIVLAND